MTETQPHTITLIDFSNTQQSSDYVSLLDAYAKDPMGGGKKLTEYTHQHLAGSLDARNDVIALLVYFGDKPAGLLTGFEGFSTFSCKPLLNIHDVYISPEFRGMGLALKLLAHAESIAMERGYCKLTLEVLENNTIAQSVYRKAGFNGYELDPQFGQAGFWEKKLSCR